MNFYFRIQTKEWQNWEKLPEVVVDFSTREEAVTHAKALAKENGTEVRMATSSPGNGNYFHPRTLTEQ